MTFFKIVSHIIVKTNKNITQALSIILLTCNFNVYATQGNDLIDRSSIESIDYYKNLANEYQTKSDMYKVLAISCESQKLAKIEKPYNPWTGTQLSFGGGNTIGNNNTANIQANLIISFKPINTDSGWNFNSIGQYDYLYSSNDGIEKNRIYLQQNNSYMFNKYNGMFGQVSYLNNVPDGYYYVWNENIGYQLQFFKTQHQNLLMSIGPGIQERQLVDPSIPDQVLPSWLTQFTYNLNLNDRITFTEQLQNIATRINTMTFSVSTITIEAYRNIGIGLNYQFTVNSNPDPKQPTYSSISGVTFVYSID